MRVSLALIHGYHVRCDIIRQSTVGWRMITVSPQRGVLLVTLTSEVKVTSVNFACIPCKARYNNLLSLCDLKCLYARIVIASDTLR